MAERPSFVPPDRLLAKLTQEPPAWLRQEVADLRAEYDRQLAVLAACEQAGGEIRQSDIDALAGLRLRIDALYADWLNES